MERHDTKYILKQDTLDQLLQYLIDYYEVLEIDTKRIFTYHTQYFDTDDYRFYHQHHNRKLIRYKVRRRNYVDSDTMYLEVKFKNNKCKTTKNATSWMKKN